MRGAAISLYISTKGYKYKYNTYTQVYVYTYSLTPCTHINLVERGDPAKEPEGEAPCQVPVVFAVLLSEPEVEKTGEGNKREQRLH